MYANVWRTMLLFHICDKLFENGVTIFTRRAWTGQTRLVWLIGSAMCLWARQRIGGEPGRVCWWFLGWAPGRVSGPVARETDTGAVGLHPSFHFRP